MKKCTQCGRELDESQFYRNKRGTLEAECKACRCARAKQWATEHPERYAERVKKWHGEHRERSNSMKRRWQAAHPNYMKDYYLAHKDDTLRRVAEWAVQHPDKVAQSKLAYKQAHPLEIREADGRRRERIAATEVVPVDYTAILEEHGLVCHICGEPISNLDELHFDHILPLARGGAHTRDNIAPAHAACNLRKGAKTMDELKTAGIEALRHARGE